MTDCMTWKVPLTVGWLISQRSSKNHQNHKLRKGSVDRLWNGATLDIKQGYGQHYLEGSLAGHQGKMRKDFPLLWKPHGSERRDIFQMGNQLHRRSWTQLREASFLFKSNKIWSELQIARWKMRKELLLNHYHLPISLQNSLYHLCSDS